MNNFSADFVAEKAREAGFDVVERTDIAAQEAEYRSIPARLHDEVRRCLESVYPDGLYAHQTRALESALDGRDICLSTSTASGKSLVFMTMAAHLLMTCPDVKVLALYPAKALIQDQLGKWAKTLKPMGLSLGRIDGSIPTARRAAILASHNVVLMTPDVAHSWLLSHLNEHEVDRFLSKLRLLILDEAHVYEGAFGTNMAYFMRRFRVAAPKFQAICCTATLSKPADFMQALTSLEPLPFGLEDDRSPSPPKSILLVKNKKDKPFDATVNLLKAIARSEGGRFLAFGDSRKMVEQLTAATHRVDDSDGEDNEEEVADGDEETMNAPFRSGGFAAPQGILPYRAGYEDIDRNQIQTALSQGTLRGVVSTSAMEMGLDIGEIDLVVMLSLPPSMKSFWQRLGRAGRRNNPGVCLLIDSRGSLTESGESLATYLKRPLEPSWIYLDNRFIQYANALCAAFEIKSRSRSDVDLSPFDTPASFRKMLDNEINPTESIPPDLYPLKQRGQENPHLEFPIRNACEKSYQIKAGPELLGNITLSQALREAYPGAIYYYMAVPYRVVHFLHRKEEIHCRRVKRWTTKPIAQTKVFPRFDVGVLKLLRSGNGFLAEAEMQISERVLGFEESRGSTKAQYLYGPESTYSQRELSRFFETTGVCWHFPDRSVYSEAIAAIIQEAYCLEFGIQERDLGIGSFHANRSPLGNEVCQGICVFDATNGSLRLTERLAQQFPIALKSALMLAHNREDEGLHRNLKMLQDFVETLREVLPDSASDVTAEEDWIIVIASGEKAFYENDGESREVEVIGYRYTPRGLMYDLRHHIEGNRWSVPDSAVRPIFGQTRRLRVNFVTGEEQPLES